ncbi:Cna B-type domain-containing protein, partial [Staphylococcus aureus]|uniref:Cna B-type domain-containing protein n=1 Tax=Staphylococcus aureus TaxID=1280 RepID=UPI001EF015EE
PEGYTKKENGLVVTNTEKPIETTSISGEKVWDDKDNQDGKRPEKVSVNLLANGEKVKTVDVTSETNWKYEFKDLPKYDEGKKIEYTVTEDHVKDYTTDINGTTITNKYTPGETSATVTKNWDDNNNQDGKRPTEIKVELYQDGKATGKTATLNESNNWTHTWTGLDEKAKGQQVKYTVEELTKVKGYTTHVDNNDMGNLIVTNKYTPETTSISGEKVWDDKDNQDGKRPEKVSVNLLANGEKVKTVDVTSETNWKYEFKDLPKYDEGKKIEYTVTEDHVKDYTTDINGTTITNKYTPGETSATVTKNWDDNNNQDGKRPTEIKVELYQDGKATGKTATLNESNNWTHTWTGLDEKAKGQQVKYTVEELTKVKGYTTHVDNNDMGNLIVTNKYTPETTSISGEKVWDDKDNQDGKRPEKVSVNLLANGEKVKTVDVTSETNWKYEFKDLPKYDEGKKIEYTVTEDHVKDYTTDINGTTITNKYTPGETSATVTKNWDDNNNQDGKRPTEIKVELYQDGKATGKTATLNESNNWTHTWTGLDEKAKGQQVKYTVEELTKVKGYTTHVDNNDMGNLIVTNKYTPETTSISGEKVWDDKDNQDGKRPEKVSVNLLANGEKVETVDVTSETNWKYEFKDLPKYDEGKKIEYTVTEDHVKDYTTDINGTTITNKYTPGETSATVTKNWDDNNNQDGKRPTEIKVELYQDGKATGKTATLNESNNWTHTWTGLDEKAKGQQVKYTVEELTKVKGYTTHVDNNDMGNLIVTNKYTPEKPNKPIYPEKPKDKTPPTKPDHSNKVKPTPPDEPSKVDKVDQPKDNKTKPENPLKELPKTGMKIITSWITWVFIGILGLYLILRKRFNS